MKKRKHWKFFVLTLLIVSVSVITSFANTAQELKNQLDEIYKNNDTLEEEYKQNEQQQKSLLEQIRTLERQIEKTEQEIKALEQEISVSEKKIEVTTGKLIEAEENINSKQELLGNRINVMYRVGTVGYAEVLLSSESFTDLLTNLDMVQRIVQHDVRLLKYLEVQRNIVEDEKAKLEAQKKQLLEQQAEVRGKNNDLQVSRGSLERKRQELVQNNAELEKAIDENNKDAEIITEKLRALMSTSEYIGGELMWPVTGYTKISSPFGNRIHPILRVNKFHSGIDIPAPSGTTVSASGPGKVIYSDTLGSYGKVVMIDHGGGIVTLYAHNSRLVVGVGEGVSRGQKIAEVGSTGLSTGPHVHFEVRENGVYKDPISYLKGN